MHGIIKCQHQGQMSESFPTAAFLSISGVLQDAYTYVFRGKVFANAQTGNIVLLSQNICERNWLQSAHYFVPLAAFAIGIIVAEQIRGKYQNVQNIHWRQIVLLLEMILLFLVSFLPQSLDMLANALVSFSCAMQVQTFRKVNGYAFASTMCIGNMRSGMEALSAYIRTHDRNVLGKALRYWEIIFLFAVGAGIGGQFVVLFGAHTIWFSCLLLLVSFCLMFIREEMKEHPEISVEEETIQKDLWDIEKQIKNIGHQVGEDISVMKSPHNKDSQ